MISEDAERSPGRDVSTLDAERVSVVIPCYNEERFIGKALNNLADQYDHDRYEIIVVDGFSEDRTREVIAEFKRRRPDVDVKLIDNPARKIPTALNLGIGAARGEIIARLDAHAVASPGYIRRSVEVLRQDGVGAVGMPCQVCPGADTLMAKAIAMAVSHPFGIGDAKYRLRKGAAEQEAVDTVAFACFKKDLWREIGGFDEELLTNEDYDFNYRVRVNGRAVLLDRAEHCEYFARPTLKDLLLQYSRYGRWKARMIRRHPRSVKWRHAVAPMFVASLPLLLIAGFWWRPAWWMLLLELAAYVLLAIVFAARLARQSGEGARLIVVLPLVFLTIHLSWGSSLLLGLISPRLAIGSGRGAATASAYDVQKLEGSNDPNDMSR
jgi:succinoglycan biosynthesis protein ExoA